MREPCSTFSASVLNVVPTSDAVPGTSRGVMVRRPPAFSMHGLMILQLRRANLRALQVAEDAKRLALFPAHFANHLDQRQLFFVGSVGKIQANHIDARAHQLAENRFSIRRRPQSGNNFCAALNRGFDSDSFQRTALKRLQIRMVELYGS